MSLVGSDDGTDFHLLSLLENGEKSELEEVKQMIYENLNTHKNSFVLNQLVSYFILTESQRALDVLVGIREPHDKHLLDRLNELMKNKEHRPKSLKLVGNIIRKQPSWLPKVCHHKLMVTFLQLLRTDNDPLNLLSSIFILIDMIPMLPSLIGPYLGDVFDVFSRLASWGTKKPASIPEVYMLHLNVGTYKLFHRLYAIYPCNFLAYLRQFYGSQNCTRENWAVFAETIRPMLERVRLHPLLVTATKDNEVSATRWKKMETHDIIVECAKLSLDPMEGIQEEMDDSLFSILCQSSSCSNLVSSIGTGNQNSPLPSAFAPAFRRPAEAASSQVENYSLVNQIENSLRYDCRVIHVKSEMESDVSQVGAASGAPTPVNFTQATSPFTVEQEEKAECRDTVGSKELNATVDAAQEAVADSATLVVDEKQAVNQYQDQPGDDDDKEVSDINTKAEKEGRSGRRDLTVSTDRKVPECDSRGPMTPFVTTTCVLTAYADNMQRDKPCELRSTSEGLPDTIPESLEQSTESTSIRDEDSYRPAAAAIDLVKQMSRFRYFSHVGPAPAFDATCDGTNWLFQHSDIRRFSSCPDLRAHETSFSDIPSSQTATPHRSYLQIQKHKSQQMDEIIQESSEQPFLSLEVKQEVTTNTTTTVKTETKFISTHEQSEFEGGSVNLRPGGSCRCSCHSSSHNKHPVARQQGFPLFLSLSPLELLDQHLHLGSEISLKGLSVPITSGKDIHWTHFGGVAPPDEVNILRGQVGLLHAQLLFERQQQEIHAERNRRLLGKAKKNRALEEQNSAHKDQLCLQEKEIQNLKADRDRLKELYSRVEKDFRHQMRSMTEERLALKQELESLKEDNVKLIECNRMSKEENTSLAQTVQGLEAELFDANQDLNKASKQTIHCNLVKEDNLKLQKEVLILGELYQKLKEEMKAVNDNHLLKPNDEDEMQLLLEASEMERQHCKASLAENQCQLDMFKARVAEFEALLAQKDATLADQKQVLDRAKSKHKGQLQVERQRIVALERVVSRLEEHILSLYGQLGLKEHEKRIKDLQLPVNQEYDDSDSTDLSVSPNVHQDELRTELNVNEGIPENGVGHSIHVRATEDLSEEETEPRDDFEEK